MKKIIVFQLIFISLVLSVVPLYSQDTKYHGADSVFEADDMAVFWAILKGPDVRSSKVYIDIVFLNGNESHFKNYQVIASNVFSDEEELVVDLTTLEESNLIVQEDESFSQMSKRRLLFYGPDDPIDKPGMEIYYIGVPDTAPEFRELEQVQAFFDHSLKMIQSSKSLIIKSELPD